MTMATLPWARKRTDTREITVQLPTMHGDQVRAWNRMTNRFAVRCGRRWGKTTFGETVACDLAIKGWPVGWFAPNYKTASAAYYDMVGMLAPITLKSNKTDGVIRTQTGGSIEVWTLEDEDAGRSRRYKMVVLDEAAFGKSNVSEIWERSIEPTLLDFNGSCLALSNTNGVDRRNFFWQICNQPLLGFKTYHAPSWANPTVPRRLPNETDAAWLERRAAAFRKLRETRSPLVYEQEYRAGFVDWSGVAFFEKAKLLEQGLPVPWPEICDQVYAIIDTATKTGKDNDGTAVIYFARTSTPGLGYPLIVLDYELQQIEGAALSTWLPNVFNRLQHLAHACRARMGVVGTFIEDKASGMVLLQQATANNWPAYPIDSKLTSLGKSERAIAASPHVYQNKVRLSGPAYDKVINYKGVTENHMLTQVLGFRVGNKDQVDDDLLDCFAYGVVLGLGNADGM